MQNMTCPDLAAGLHLDPKFGHRVTTVALERLVAKEIQGLDAVEKFAGVKTICGAFRPVRLRLPGFQSDMFSVFGQDDGSRICQL